MQKNMLLLVALCVSALRTEAANILVLTPMGSQSHKIFYMGIVNELAERGHKVTILSAYKNSKEVKNVVDVAIPELSIMGILSNVFEEEGSGNVLKDLFVNSPYLCNQGLAVKGVQDLKKEKYDVILISLFFSFCYYSFINHFQVPYIFLLPAGLFGPFADITGSVDFPSIAANKMLDAQFPLTFIERLLTVGLNFVMTSAGTYYLYPKSEEICKEKGLCPLDMPHFHEYSKNVSLTIVNSFRSLESPPRPSMPNVIHAGGAHMKPGKPLPKELEKWIQEAGSSGFIFLSLGSGVKPSDMPEKHRKTFVNVFRTLPQRVLWKWDEDTMPDLPSNVKLSKWLPQQDILAHRDLKLFITHGGLLSTMEATYHGVPCLGMPIFADQFSNVKDAAGEGWARVLLWKDLTDVSLKTIISDIIVNNSLREMSAKRGALMKDVPIKPADEAAFWVEFVIRHRGAKHLQSPLFQISWYEFNNVDVWATIGFVLFIIIYINFLIIKVIFQLCFGKASKNVRKSYKKKKQ